MKKNRMMRLASILMVCVLLTTSVISGTFAKYTTKDSASDTARVAKWGVKVAVGGDLFAADYYAFAEEDENSNQISAVNSQSVHGQSGAKVVAPGTTNDTKNFEIHIQGTPEVAYNIIAKTGENVTNVATANKDIFLGKGFWGVMVLANEKINADGISNYYTLNKDTGEYTRATGTFAQGTDYYELHDAVELAQDYYPIKWTVKKIGQNTTEINTDRNLVEIAKEMAKNLTTEDPGSPAVQLIAGYKLTWEWPFTGQNDVADTILGNLHTGSLATVVYAADANGPYKIAKDNGKYCLDIVFNFEVVVEQVD